MNYAVPRDYLNDVNPAISAHVAVDDLPLAEVPGIECLSSVTEVLAYRAWRQPDAIAFIHLLDGE
ncbi:AMP-binding protein, partial [Pseudomonas sp. SIMBA_077]